MSVIANVTNPVPTLPEMTSLEEARGIVADQFQTIRQLLWRVAQLEKQIYGASSERHLLDPLSKELAYQERIASAPAPGGGPLPQQVPPGFGP